MALVLYDPNQDMMEPSMASPSQPSNDGVDMAVVVSNPKQKRRQPSAKASPFQPSDDGNDRLTFLPSKLRTNILNRLPLNYAIRTGALSKRWKGFWMLRYSNRDSFVAKLLLPNDSHPIPYFLRLSRFLQDPSRVMRSLSLSFYCSDAGLLTHLSSLLHQAALTQEVADLDIDLGRMVPKYQYSIIHLDLRAPFGFTLVKLSLSGLRLVLTDPSYFQTLVNLQYLILRKVNMPDADFRKLLRNCSSLRVVEVEGCPDFKRLAIRGKAAEKVVVVGCASLEEVTVAGEMVKKFHFKGKFARKYVFAKCIKGLKDVFISCCESEASLPQSNWVGAIAGVLGSVVVFTLCSLALQYMLLSADAEVTEKFNNFEHLTELQFLMYSLSEDNHDHIFKFFSLCSCPNMERLFIEFPSAPSYRDPSLRNTLLEGVVYPETQVSILSGLKTIKLYNFRNYVYEVRVVRFLLANSPVLETLTVIAPMTCARAMHAQILDGYRRDFEELPRLSMNAMIDVRGVDSGWVKPVHNELYFEL